MFAGVLALVVVFLVSTASASCPAVISKHGELQALSTLRCRLEPSTLPSGGSTVSSWSDSSQSVGGGCVVGQSTVGLKPSVVTDCLDGRSCVRLGGGSGTYLVDTSASTASYLLAENRAVKPFTAVFVTRLGPDAVGTASPWPALFTIKGATAHLKLQLKDVGSNRGKFMIGWGSDTVDTGLSVDLRGWHIIVLVQSASSTQVYIDGTAVVAPFTPAAELLSQGDAGVGSFASMEVLFGQGETNAFKWQGDLAEFLLYSEDLCVTAIDRLGYYLARRYSLNWILTPGTTGHTGNSALPTPINMNPAQVNALGGQVVTLSGDRLAPADFAIGMALSDIQDALSVSVGTFLPICSASSAGFGNHSETMMRVEHECLQYSATLTGPPVVSSPAGTPAMVSCTVPPVIAVKQSLDIVVRWFGVPVTVTGLEYAPPVVDVVVPNMVQYTGGTLITFWGSNFGSQDFWIGGIVGGSGVVSAELRPVGSLKPIKCLNTTIISDRQVECTVPALPMSKVTVDTSANTVGVFASLLVGHRRATGSNVKLSYSGVPKYYSCDNSQLGSMRCLTCCYETCATSVLRDPAAPLVYENCNQAEWNACNTYCTVPLEATVKHQAEQLQSEETPCVQRQLGDVNTPWTAVLFQSRADAGGNVGDMVAFRAPIIDRITPSTLQPGVSTVITIAGVGLGSNDKLVLVQDGRSCHGLSMDGTITALTAIDSFTATASVTMSSAGTVSLCFKSSIEPFFRPVPATITLNVAGTNAAPTIQAIQSSDVRATGAASVTILGSGFGGYDASLTLRIGTVGLTSRWRSVSEVVCKLATGAGLQVARSIVVTMSTLNRATERSGFLFQGPSGSSVTIQNVPGTGSASVTIVGASFPQHRSSHRAAVGLTVALCSQWISSSSLNLKTNRLARKSLVTFTVFGQMGQVFNKALSIVAPTASSLTRVNGPGSGSASLTLLGVSFSGYANSGIARISVTSTLASNWAADSAVTLKACSGNGPAYEVVVSLGMPGRDSVAAFDDHEGHVIRRQFTSAYSYDYTSMALTSQATENLPATGGVSVTVYGTYFAKSADQTTRFRMGGSHSEATKWTSMTAVSSKSGLSLFLNNHIVITTAANNAIQSSLSKAVTFNRFVTASSINKVNMAATGAVSVTLLGSGLHPSVSSPAHRITDAGRRGSGSEASVWASDTSSHLKATAGISKGVTRSCVVSLQWTTGFLPDVLSWDIGARSGGGHNSAASGAVGVTVVGAPHWCKPGLSSRFRVGGSGGESSRWLSSTSLFVKTPYGAAFGRVNLGFMLTIGTRQLSLHNDGRSTITFAITFDRALVSSMLQTNAPATGMTSVTILGSDYHTFDLTWPTSSGSTTGESHQWISSSCMRLKRVSLVGRLASLDAIVTVNHLMGEPMGGTLSQTFSYAAFHSMGGFRTNMPGTGSVSVTLISSTSHAEAVSPRMRFSGCVSESTMWHSSSALKSKSNADSVFPRSAIAATISTWKDRNIGTTLTQAFSHDSAVNVLKESPTKRYNIPATGSVSVTLVSAYAGFNTDLTRPTRAIATRSEASTWLSSTMVQAKPAGRHSLKVIGDDSIIVVSMVGAKTNSLTSVFTIDTQQTLTRVLHNSATTGASSVSIVGRGLVSHGTHVARMGGTNMETTAWRSSSNVICKASHQYLVHGARGRMVVTLSNSNWEETSMTNLFTFDGMLVTQVPVLNLHPTGAIQVTVIGTQLDKMSHTGSARLGLSAQESTSWVSGTVLKWKSAQNTMGGYRRTLAITSAIDEPKRRTTALLYSYDWIADAAASLRANLCSTGAASVTILGASFGSEGVTVQTSNIRLVQTGSESTTWVSCTSIYNKQTMSSASKQAAIVSLLSWRASDIFKKSVVGSFSIDRIDISSIIRSNYPSSGSYSMTIFATGAGLMETMTVRLGWTSNEASIWSSDTSLMTKTAKSTSVGQGKALVLTSTKNVNTGIGMFTLMTYNGIFRLSSLVKGNSPITGHVSLTVIGLEDGFATGNNHFPLARTGDSNSMATQWSGDTSLMVKCHLPGINSFGKKQKIVVTMRDLKHRASVSNVFTYDLGDAHPPTDWIELTSRAPWSAREFGVAHSPNCECIGDTCFCNILLLGGSGSGGSLNDVWHYNDFTNTWIEKTSRATWRARQRMTMTSNLGVLYMFGGGSATAPSGTGFNDAYTSTDGISWAQKTSEAGWSPRYEHGTCNYGGLLVLSGGLEHATRTYKHDVWSTIDGVVWSLLTSTASFGARAGHGHAVMNAKMWVYGGAKTDADADNWGDVWWSTDGSNWNLAAGDGAFRGRRNGVFLMSWQKFTFVLWAMGGATADSPNSVKNDAWSSTDGFVWRENPIGTRRWSERRNMMGCAEATGRKVYVMGSQMAFKNDVWYQFW